mmetsp:Transcript_2676/g.6710  ORF Transcript_2676/g.6710 Transcript_2676/m.6710 type:complete len:425 (+) Transcript_2676:238-1512(+)
MPHPLKRARVAASDTMDAPPAPVALTKAALALADRPLPSGAHGAQLSPGATFGCRVAVQTPRDGAARLFLASGASLYCASVPAADGGAGGLTKGKEGVCIPAIAPQPIQAEPVGVAQHLAEVQSVQVAEVDGQLLVGSIDALGRASVLRAPLDDGTAPSAHFMPSHTYQLAPPAAVREPGWAGIALSRQQADLVATATHFDRELVVYEGQVPLRTLGLAASPTSVMFLPSSFPGCSSGSVIAATHGQNVGIWDIRAAGFGALVTQLNLNASTEMLYTVQCSEGSRPVIGAAGGERAVGVWEPRKWTYVSRWNNCLKYEVFAMHFSTINPDYCYVAGADYEVLCGTWNRSQRSGGGARTGKGSGHRPEQSEHSLERAAAQPMAFRGDARWLGLARAQGADVLAGLSSSGYVFVARMQPGNTLGSL